MAALLLRGFEADFSYYYPFCIDYEGVEGVVRLAAEANEWKADSWNGYKSSPSTRCVHMLYVADVLIEIISRFKSLLEIRLSYAPSSEPLTDIASITTQPAQAWPAIAEQKAESSCRPCSTAQKLRQKQILRLRAQDKIQPGRRVALSAQ